MKTILIISHLVISSASLEATEVYKVQAQEPMLISEIYIAPEMVYDFDYLLSEDTMNETFNVSQVESPLPMLTVQDIRNKGQPQHTSIYKFKSKSSDNIQSFFCIFSSPITYTTIISFDSIILIYFPKYTL